MKEEVQEANAHHILTLSTSPADMAKSTATPLHLVDPRPSRRDLSPGLRLGHRTRDRTGTVSIPISCASHGRLLWPAPRPRLVVNTIPRSTCRLARSGERRRTKRSATKKTLCRSSPPVVGTAVRLLFEKHVCICAESRSIVSSKLILSLVFD